MTAPYEEIREARIEQANALIITGEWDILGSHVLTNYGWTSYIVYVMGKKRKS